MTDATAKLKNYRQSPRKVRLVADLVRGKNVEHALALLATLPKRASEPMAKLIRSAVANARTNKGVEAANLIISHVDVGQGIVFKRSMPRARGRASAIRKKSSHITLALSARPQK
ncbi:MAG: 50S ribosomal protein L22 [Patescibacteria group bacterium]